MDAAELVEWEAIYTQIEPLPEARADLRMGIAVANGLAPHLKKGAMVQPADFIPRFDAPAKRPQQSIADMQAIWTGIEKAWNRPKKE